MNTKYLAALGLALAGFSLYYFLEKKKNTQHSETYKEGERHHLTTAFSRAKQVAVGR